MPSMRALSLLVLFTSLATPRVSLGQSPFRTDFASGMPPSVFAESFCTGDVDGDGDLDVVVGDGVTSNQLLLNDGRGNFVDATAGRLVTPTTPAIPSLPWINATMQVDLVDIDGDADLDLLMVNYEVWNRVYRNDGAGFFTDITATAVPQAWHGHRDQVVADFDGDGDVDWLTCFDDGSVATPMAILYLNDGTGTFSPSPASLPPGVTGWGGSFAADLDNDGDLDVVLSRASTILVNQGNATFTSMTLQSTPPAGPFPGAIFGADVDNDGDVDLLVEDGQRLLRNLAGLTFAPTPWLPDKTLAALDFDGDGDVDLIGLTTSMVNDGTGTFTAVPSGATLPPLPRDLRIADLDGDGDPDAVALYAAGPVAAFDFFTQIHTPTPPMLGQPYTLELFAPVRPSPVVWAPGFANAPGLATLPGFVGALRLDPVSAAPLFLVFSTTGHDTLAWTIPNQPLLLGTELHFQAAVLDPLRPPLLSNALRDVIQ